MAATRILIYVMIFVLGSSCSVDPTLRGTIGESHEDGEPAPILVQVKPIYPSNGVDWTYYVKNNGSDIWLADDTACDPLSDTSCLHGAELLQVELTGISSCVNLTLSDSLGAFDWVCVDNSGTAIFRTLGLKTDKGLKDLLQAGQFKENFVEIFYSGKKIAYSQAVVWWGNPIVALPFSTSHLVLDGTDDDGSGEDQEYVEGTIFYFSGSQTTDEGYEFGLDHMALVGLENGTLTYSGSGSTVCDTIACIGFAETKNFLWLEGTFRGDDTSDLYVLVFSEVRFSRIQFLDIRDSGTKDALQFDNSHHNTVREYVAINNGYTDVGAGLGLYSGSSYNMVDKVFVDKCGFGVALYTGGNHHNQLTNIRISRVNYYGLYLRDSDNNYFSQVTSSNNDEWGVMMFDGSDNNVFSHIVSVNNGSEGVRIYSNSSGNKFYNMTVANNSTGGVRFDNGGVGNYLINVVSANNNGPGFSFTNTSHSNEVINSVSAHNNTDGVYIDASNDNIFSGAFSVDNNGGDPCEVLVGTTGNTFDDGATSCTHANPSLTVTNTIDLSSTYGPYVEDDTSNAHTVDLIGGVLAQASITDWLFFDSGFRSWGKSDPGGLLVAANRSRCSSGNCAIWDWRPLETDVELRNHLGSFVADDPCPIDGSDLVDDGGGNVFLNSAIETLGDGIGDEDLLCESGEACLYSAHLGAYQGSGTPSSCQFTDGTVSGVALSGY